MAVEILVINPGGTSTKVGWFRNNEKVFDKTVEHDSEELKKFDHVRDQLNLRLNGILQAMAENKVRVQDISAVSARSGLLPPLEAGAYEVNEAMIDWSLNKSRLNHGSDLSGILARTMAEKAGPNVKAYIYDGESLDQFGPLARYSGVKMIPRASLGHLLNMREMGRRVAERLGRRFDEVNFVACHMGGGTSLCAMEKSRVVDAIPDDEGPCSVERSGKVALKHIINLCYDKPRAEVMSLLRRDGGLKSYLGTNDGREIVRRIEAGDEYAREVFESLAYQAAKAIGEMAVVLKGEVDGVILTGGLARSKLITGWIEERVSFLAPVYVEPGERELEALAGGIYRVLKGEESVNTFTA
ncbi:MAG: butyrate kinase [Candidatus Adiutrix sp.]|jgi:butyrate kinase|nr:butyrate kinase [Candidatus Adiutrix sp.]